MKNEIGSRNECIEKVDEWMCINSVAFGSSPAPMDKAYAS
jgi:hypothetical protein